MEREKTDEIVTRLTATEARLSALEHKQSRIEALFLDHEKSFRIQERLMAEMNLKVDRVLKLLENKEQETKP